MQHSEKDFRDRQDRLVVNVFLAAMNPESTCQLSLDVFLRLTASVASTEPFRARTRRHRVSILEVSCCAESSSEICRLDSCIRSH